MDKYNQKVHVGAFEGGEAGCVVGGRPKPVYTSAIITSSAQTSLVTTTHKYAQADAMMFTVCAWNTPTYAASKKGHIGTADNAGHVCINVMVVACALFVFSKV